MDKIRVVEIGGTHIRRGDVTNGDISNITRERTAEVLVGDVLASLDKFIRESWSNDIQKLVILVAGPVKDNIVARMPNFPPFPNNIDLTKELKFDVPILVFNDMTAAVTGMAELLKKQGIDTPFWGITWSTGLGGKFWDGEKISIDQEIGHEILIDGVEAEELLGGRHLNAPAGPKEMALMNRFLDELQKIAPTKLFVMKGAIAKALFSDSKNPQTVQILLSPEPEKDSFLGAWILSE